MNSESGKARLGSDTFTAPFRVLKILGCGVFGRIDFNRLRLQRLRSMYGASFVAKWKLPAGSQADHSVAIRVSRVTSGESFGSSRPCCTNSARAARTLC